MIAEVREVYAQEIMRLKKELTALREQLAEKEKVLEQNRVTKLDIDAMIDNYLRLEAENATLRLKVDAVLREQLKDCSAAFDRQQEQLDKNAEQIATLREQLAEKEDTETPHYTNCFGSGPQHYVCALMEITDLRNRLQTETQLLLDGNKIASKEHRKEVAALREALSRLIEVHDAMGGMCGTVRIAAEEALAKEEGK